MKAKDYAAKFSEEKTQGKESIDCLTTILNDFTREMGQLSESRNVQTDSAVLAIYRELDQKYRAFCRLASTEDCIIKPDGWRFFLQETQPEIWGIIKVMEMREKQRVR